MSYWQRRKNIAYYQRVRSTIENLSPGNSILDVGSYDTPIATWGDFDRRYAIDLVEREELPGVTQIVDDFLTWEVPEAFSVVTCLQVLEHLPTNSAKAFGRKLITSGRFIVVSIPYRWRKGLYPPHLQDPVDEEKLESFMGKEPRELELLEHPKYARMIAIYDGEPG